MGGPWEKYQQQSSTDGPWKQYQTPVPQSGIPEAGPSRAGLDFEMLGDMAADVAKKGALPTAGSIALPAAGTALLGPANLPFVPLEMGLGSGLGEAANQVLGITEPSLSQIGIATGLPAAVGYGTQAVRSIAGLPRLLNREAPGMAKTQIGAYRGDVSASQAMEEATQQGLTIPMSKTTEALQEIRTIMGDKTPASMRAFEKVLNDTGLDAAAATGQISPAKMQGLLEDIGALKANADDGIEKKYLGKFFSALNDDLDNSGAALKQARTYWKREQVLNDIDERINKAVFTPKGQGADTQFSAQKIINELNDTSEGLGKWFSQSFSAKEQKELKGLFSFLNTIPSLQPGAGQQYGFGRLASKLTQGAAGGGIGYGIGMYTGIPGAAEVGVGLGVLAPEATNVANMVMQAYKMPGGKQAIRNFFEESSAPGALAALSAFVTGGVASNGKEPIQFGTMLQPFGNEQ